MNRCMEIWGRQLCLDLKFENRLMKVLRLSIDDDINLTFLEKSQSPWAWTRDGFRDFRALDEFFFVGIFLFCNINTQRNIKKFKIHFIFYSWILIIIKKILKVSKSKPKKIGKKIAFTLLLELLQKQTNKWTETIFFK